MSLKVSFLNWKQTTGANFTQVTKGKHDIKAGKHIKSATKVHTLSGSDKIVIKGNGGTIILDASGITLKGVVQIKGSLAVSGGGVDGLEMFEAAANEGTPICIPCLLKALEEAGE